MNQTTPLKDIYARRFREDAEFRNRMYQVLCGDFFSRFIPADATVIDVAAGYCEFINNIRAGKKYAVDLNSDTRSYAAKDVEVIQSPSSNMSSVGNDLADIVFVSNFFEHLSREEIIKTLREIHRVLKKGGELLILQPNYRYCSRDYWMFFDHVTAVDDRALVEALEIYGFEVAENRPRFLPFTTKSRFPKNLAFLRIYLKVPLLQKMFGQQAFIRARKS